MLKILLKIWPGLIPFVVYFFWLIIFRLISKSFLKKSQKEKIIDAEIIEEQKPLISKNDFSLSNNLFFAIFIISCLLMIFTIIRFGTQNPAFDGKYVPAKIQKDGSIKGGKFK
tara:strand:+ start:364 stop:702 length:339 start_codon:yes stop_codon:yes gene_type:complete